MLNYKGIPSEELLYPYEYKRHPLYLRVSWEARHFCVLYQIADVFIIITLIMMTPFVSSTLIKHCCHNGPLF